ncbi:prephenate dehydratase domain-containing protein [Actinomycetes bacterium KLBMP 9759]
MVVIGIQGGRGSFNEEAARTHLPQRVTEPYEIRHLYTTPNVLQALEKGEIDRGQFALFNTSGGVYEESLQAIAEHTFKIVDRYLLNIRHSLMIHKDAELAEVTTIVTHSQVLQQCKASLAAKYPHLRLEVGENELTDPARIAEAIADGRLPKSIATLSNRLMADAYGLSIVENDLQDRSDSESTFLLVERTVR